MKRPREILFRHHQAVGPKLDQVRRNVLATLNPKARPEPNPSGEVGSWKTLLLSLRWHFSALSAVWLLVAMLNLEAGAPPPLVAAQQLALPPHQLLTALRENRRHLAQLLDVPPGPERAASPIERPTSALQPRRPASETNWRGQLKSDHALV